MIFRIYRIDGNSMLPVLASGDYVIASRLRKPRVGRLAVVRHPVYLILIKRIKAINAQGGFLLEGENKESISTEKMGWFSPVQLQGVVFYSVSSPKKGML